MDVPLKLNRDVDILFMIDDSPSMADKQHNLATQFGEFVNVLNTVQGGLPNLHVGVVTSDLGAWAADGQIGGGIGTLGAGGCSGKGKAGNLQLFGAPVSGAPFLSDILQADGTRQINYTGTLADAFAHMAQAGAGGCGFEQPLEAVKRALSSITVANNGFLRNDASLVVVLLTDEDDCSIAHPTLLDPTTNGPLGALESFRCTRFGVTCQTGGATPDQMNVVGPKDQCVPSADHTYLTDVSGYTVFLRALKADPAQVMVAAIAGPTAPFAVELRAPTGNAAPIPALAHSCTYSGADGVEVADPPVRIKALLDQFPNRHAFEPICQADLSVPLIDIATKIKSMIGDPCIEANLADSDPTTPGLQPACNVAMQVGGATTPMQQCKLVNGAATNAPCWHLVEDAALCASTPTKIRIAIEGQDTLPANAHILSSCQIQP